MLEILYQDDFIVAINKPSGLLVHRSPIDKNETRFALQLLKEQIGKYVYPIHRLDKPTSGVLLFALDKESAKILGEQFGTNEIKKSYMAVVRGYTEQSGTIDHPLSVKLDKMTDKMSTCKEAKEALSEYERIDTVELPFCVGKYDTVRYSLVRLFPKTGRKHQLRRHMKHISHHILGDTKYGRGEHNKFIREHLGCNRMMLHAQSLSLRHPRTNDILTIKAPFDDTFNALFDSFGWNVSI